MNTESTAPPSDDRAWVEVAKRVVGEIVSGQVVKVEPNFAILEAAELPITSRAFLHISQYSNEHVDNLPSVLQVGAKVKFLVHRLNHLKNEWDVSVRGVSIRTLCDEKYPLGSVHRATLQRKSVAGAIYSIGELPARSGKDETALLELTDSLEIGTSRDVRIVGIDPMFSGVIVTSGAVVEYSPGTIVEATIQFVGYDYKTGNRKSRWSVLLYAVANDGTVFQSKLWRFVDPLSRFTQGSRVQLSVIRRSSERYFYWGAVVGPVSLIEPFCRPPSIGNTTQATVNLVENFAAFCSVQDGRDEMIHRTQFAKDSVADLRAHVAPGDILEVTVREPEGQEQDFGLTFVRLLRRVSGISPVISDGLQFDLTATRRRGAASGFLRSTKFKDETLAVFAHTCVFCGICLAVAPSISAAEAAHVVPRSNRGLDSVTNGLCLCKTHHWAFDRGLMTISEDRRTMVCGALRYMNTGLAKALADLHDTEIVWPLNHEFPIEAFLWHRRNVFLNVESLTDA